MVWWQKDMFWIVVDELDHARSIARAVLGGKRLEAAE
jgi:hypothetical protein